eukprot:2234572-Karenia_brevis.AAC.1
MHRHSRIAFDFAVINSLGQGHLAKTLQETGAAVEAYAERKKRHQKSVRKCDDAGVFFQPLAFDSQGGMTSETT